MALRVAPSESTWPITFGQILCKLSLRERENKKTADNGNAMPGWYWLEGHTEFSEVVRIAMKRILQGALPNEISPDEIRKEIVKKIIIFVFRDRTIVDSI